MRHRVSPHFEALLLHLSEFQKVPLTRIPQFIQVTRLLIGINFDGAQQINPLTPNDRYSGRTAPLTSKRCILYIYSTNIGTEYFKHGIYCPSFSLQNAVCFIILT